MPRRVRLRRPGQEPPGFHIGWWYILPIGLLLAQYTFTGYDASAHMTEETLSAARAGRAGS